MGYASKENTLFLKGKFFLEETNGFFKKNIPFRNSLLFPLRVDPVLKGCKKECCRIAAPESIFTHLIKAIIYRKKSIFNTNIHNRISLCDISSN